MMPLEPGAVMVEVAPQLRRFLDALPHAKDEEFVNAPGVGVFRAKHVRRGLESGVLVVHWTGFGLCLTQPKEHGVCPHCAASKSRALCEHCACKVCSWFRRTEERSSPPVSRDKLLRLTARLKAFRFGTPQLPASPGDDLL
jgi:hypothetical protein